MDEFAEHIYQRRPEYRHLSAGDVTAQKKLRSSLNCKSFKWFMTKIAWDLPKFYPPVEPPAAAWGEVSLEGRPTTQLGPSAKCTWKPQFQDRKSPGKSIQCEIFSFLSWSLSSLVIVGFFYLLFNDLSREKLKL